VRKISHRSSVRDWITRRPVDDALYRGGFSLALSQPNEQDDSYRKLSLFPRGDKL